MDKATSTTSVLGPATKHLHCFHGEEFFSKFKFYDGVYDDMDVSDYTKLETPQAYAAMFALSSARMSVKELVAYVQDNNGMISHAWMRPTPS